MNKLLIALALLLTACVELPEQVHPVEQFKLSSYLGKWYEIARLEQRFEEGLSKISAEYSLREDGGVKVLNRGYSAASGTWEEVEGKAYFVDKTDQGFLKVSFFGPFYGSYIVFELDQKNYQYALVSGPDKSYLWLLARTPHIDKTLQDQLIAKAAALGFDTSKLVYVNHD